MPTISTKHSIETLHLPEISGVEHQSSLGADRESSRAVFRQEQCHVNIREIEHADISVLALAGE